MTNRIDLNPDDVAISRVLLLDSVPAIHWPADDSNRTRMVMRAATILTAGGLILGLFFIGQPASAPFIVGMVLAVALPFIVFVGTFHWSQFFRRTHQGPPSSESISTVLPRWSPEADEEVVKTITSWFKFDPRPHPELIAVCHPSITAIVGLQGPPHLLEAEPLIEGDVKILSGRLLLAAISVIGMVVLIVAIEGGFSGMALIMMAPMWGFVIPVGMTVLRWIRSRGGPRFIIGTGFVRNTTTDRVISVDDAVLYARPSRVMAHGAAYFVDVDLIGSDLRLRFQFRDPRCREFRALWERWCHPNPRPELASAAIG